MWILTFWGKEINKQTFLGDVYYVFLISQDAPA